MNRTWLLGTGLVTLLSTPAMAISLGVGLEGGMGIPFGRYPDQIVVPVDPPTAEGISSMMLGLNSRVHAFGGAFFRFGVLDFGVRYHQWSINKVAITEVNKTALDPAQEFSFEEASMDPMKLKLTTFDLGFTIDPFENDLLDLWSELGVGGAMVTVDTEDLYGLHAHAAVGLAFKFASIVRVGPMVRYNFVLTNKPDTLGQALGAVASGSNIVSSISNTLHYLDVGATAAVMF